MAYTAPTIKDRVAAGDNKYTMQTLSDGKVLLTPAPDEVSEPGTEINRALLQPLFDLAAAHDSNLAAIFAELGILAPYEDYWWRTRQVSAGYTLELAPASQISGAYYQESISHTSYTESFYAILINEKIVDSDGSYSDNGQQTIKYASSITMDSSGNISLVNPTTVTVNADTVESYQSTLRGKYVSGLDQSENTIYKIGQYATISEWTPNPMSYGSYTRYKTRWGYKASDVSSLPAEVAKATYSASTSDYSYLHNAESDFYPHSGTSNGVEYQYLGRISDFAPAAAPNTIKYINVTSASWSSDEYSIAMPCSRYLLWAEYSSGVSGSGFVGMVDDAYLYGAVGETTYVKSTQAKIGTITIIPTASGLTLLCSSTVGPSARLAYLPLK